MILQTGTKRKTEGWTQSQALAYADEYLRRRYGLRWDDLQDTVAAWDFAELTKEDVRERCEDKVRRARYIR